MTPAIQLAPDEDKFSIRQKVWDHLEQTNLAMFPRPVYNRIPNFKGATEACDRVTSIDAFKKAHIIKVNPDKPQEQVRFRILEAHKQLLVPTPRLRSGLFNKIIPPHEGGKRALRQCATSQGVKEHSVPIGLGAKLKVDLVILGSVAASPTGIRIGKGEGFADMEYAMMVAMGAVDESTLVVTTVHDCQVLDIPEELVASHDVPVDYIVTPTRIIQCPHRSKPPGIIWSQLSQEKYNQVPILKQLRFEDQKAGKNIELSGELGIGTQISLNEGHVGSEFQGRIKKVVSKRSEHNQGSAEFSVYIGGLHQDTRVSHLKAELQRRKVFPLRIVWRGDSGYALCIFKVLDDVDDSIEKLAGMELLGKPLEIQLSQGKSGEGKPGFDKVVNSGGVERPKGADETKRPERDLHQVYVGGIRKNSRVSEFKAVVRERGVYPVRVIWKSGFAFLTFDEVPDVELALVKLKDLQINGRHVIVEKCTGHR